MRIVNLIDILNSRFDLLIKNETVATIYISRDNALARSVYKFKPPCLLTYIFRANCRGWQPVKGQFCSRNSCSSILSVGFFKNSPLID